MKISIIKIILLICFLSLTACSSDKEENAGEKQTNDLTEQLPAYPSSVLPEGLVWETNYKDPVYASEQALKGGTFRTFMLAFPLTLRSVGPDSNSSFRSLLDGNRLSLVSLHPNTIQIIPELATHWAYGDDGKTVYYRLNPQARWSDGEPVTADDYLFTLDFMRSRFIVAPWYNNYFTERIKEVKKYDDHTISVTGADQKPKIDLHVEYGIPPMPRHFHKLNENWVTDYNWRVEPNTGPYQISKVEKGKYVEFSLQQDWWAKDLHYFKNRFNVKKVRVTVIRDLESAFRYFLKGELDAFPLNFPNFWHDKARGELFDHGYIHKIWFFNDKPQPSYGMYLNQDIDLFKDRNVRYGFAHAMNIDRMIKTVLRNDYLRLHNIHTGYGDYSNNKIRARKFDLDKADDYFSHAGWHERGTDGIRIKDNKRLAVTVTYGTPEHTDRLIVLKEEAKKAGVELNLELLDSSATFKKILEKKHEIAWMAWSTGFRPAYWEHFHSDNAHKPQTNNITNTDDADIDALIMQYRAEMTHDRRASLARQLQVEVHERGAIVPTIMVPYTRSAYWRWLQLPAFYGTMQSGSVFDLFGNTGGLFWIDVDEKRRTLDARDKGEKFEAVTIIDETYKVD